MASTIPFDSPEAIAPIQRRRLYQEVADRLERLIREGTFSEGANLPSERELTERFGVGRPAVREALLSLQKSGLVTVSNGERARVSRPTAERLLDGLSAAARMMLADEQGMRDFQSARRLIEMTLAREAARRATPQHVAALREALARNKDARGDPAAFQRTDVAFHREIARIAGNPMLIGLHEALSSWLTEQRTVSLRRQGAERHAFDYHTRLFNAIEARDPDAAEAAMGVHLERTAEFYWEVASPVAGSAGARKSKSSAARLRAR